MKIIVDPKAAAESRARTAAFMDAQRFTDRPSPKNWVLAFVIALTLVVSGVRCCAAEAQQTKLELAAQLSVILLDEAEFYRGVRIGTLAAAEELGETAEKAEASAVRAVEQMRQKAVLRKMQADLLLVLLEKFDEQELADLISVYQLKLVRRFNAEVAPELLKSALKRGRE